MENDLYIPLSYISQYYFCPRRAALIMLEQVWSNNEETAAGTIEHDRVHDKRLEKRGSSLKVYGLTISSDKLHLSGKCDCVEAEEDDKGCVLPFAVSRYTIYPVEYKHGVVRNENEYNLQLCAQAMCLEEMYNCSIPKGAIFYISSHRRQEVYFTHDMRCKVEAGAKVLKDFLESGTIPKGEWEPKCRKCSLIDICGPKTKKSARQYNKSIIDYACNDEDIVL